MDNFTLHNNNYFNCNCDTFIWRCCCPFYNFIWNIDLKSAGLGCVLSAAQQPPVTGTASTLRLQTPADTFCAPHSTHTGRLWKEVMYIFYVLIYLKFTPLKTWFFNFSFHQYSLFYLYFLKTKAFGNLSKKNVLRGVWTRSFLTLFFDRQQVPFSTQQGAYVHNRKRAHSYTMEQIGT